MTFVDDAADSGGDPSSASLLCAKDQGSYDRQSFRSSYTTAPLASDVTIAGSTEATIQAAFPGSDGHLVVQLSWRPTAARRKHVGKRCRAERGRARNRRCHSDTYGLG